MHTYTRFGPYEIVEEIGHGGMGLVYRARDSRLNRDVALKVVADNFLSEGTPTSASPTLASRDRFMREARASSALNHPNICTIYDVGEQDGQPYLVMELLEGRTLKQVINGHALSVECLVDYGIQLCAALAEAHGRGFLHRDIKPSNLFVTRMQQGNGVLKVLDFGIAKRTTLASSTSDTIEEIVIGATATLTDDGTTLGTVAYMSPEQARGEPIDPRADVFSAGVVLYEMATGSTPFYGSSMAEIFAALLTKDPAPIRASQPRFPRELERVIFKALARDRDRRYASAADLRADLLDVQVAFSAGGSATARLTRGIRVARDFPRPGASRRGLWIGLAAVLLLVIAGAGVFHWWSSRPVPKVAQPDPVVVSELGNSTGDPVFDGTLRQALSFELGRSPQLAIVGDSRLHDMLAYLVQPADAHLTPAVTREIAERESDAAVVNGTISAIGSDYLVTLEAQRPATGEVFARAQAQADGKNHVLTALRSAAQELRGHMEEVLAAEPVPLSEIQPATTASAEAFRAYAAGERELARANFAQSIHEYQHATEIDPDFAMAYARLGVAQVAVGSPSEGNAAISHAFALSSKVSERERLYIRIQYSLDVSGDLPEAIDALRLYAQNYPHEPLAPTDLSVAYLTLGKYPEAWEQAQKAIVMNPQKGSGYVNALLALTALNRFSEAKALYEKAASLGLADDGSIRGTWIFTAWLTGDRVEVERQLEWARDRTDGFLVHSQAALLDETEGRFARAGDDWQRAVRQLEQQGMQNATAMMIAQRSLDAALAQRCDGSGAALDLAMRRDRDRFMQGTAAIAYALCGDATKAQAIEASLAQSYPQDTLINHVYLPDIAAAIELQHHKPDAALNALGVAEGYETLGISSYLRGLAYLDLKQGTEAAAAFRIPVSSRSIFVLSQQPGMNVALPLSLLGLARAENLAGDQVAAHRDYSAFFDAWKNADAALRPLVAARAEAGHSAE
ncbi:protein kinase domain-containing protein [Silvibacterium sp.]|uniref:protein kinase domain-containing protein n=1 Tax=Silvibacterium sp. TaxID=1964179 RepID=UPI0039E2254F